MHRFVARSRETERGDATIERASEKERKERERSRDPVVECDERCSDVARLRVCERERRNVTRNLSCARTRARVYVCEMCAEKMRVLRRKWIGLRETVRKRTCLSRAGQKLK